MLNARKQRKTSIAVLPNGIVTPAAADAARKHSITIRTQEPGSTSPNMAPQSKAIGLVVLGCDHGGFDLKMDLLSLLDTLGYKTEDVGTFSTDSVDYPDYAHLVAQRVARDAATVGVIVDGAGVGSAMAANKVPGVRAAACYDVCTARNSREHNFANVLTLGSRVTGIDIAREILKAWLGTDFGVERHRLRVDKIMAIEDTYRRKA